MHEHDYEIIMALAEGTLDADSALVAAAEIATCAECSADLDMQRYTISALADTPDVYLTATESADLHANLHRELSLAGPVARPKRSFAWAKWVPVAGVAAVFLAAVVFFPGMNGDSDDAADETMAAAETTAAGSFEMEDAPAMEALPQESPNDLRAGSDAVDGAASATTAAPATTEAPAATTTTLAPETTASDLVSVMDGLEYLGEIEDLNTVELRYRIEADLELLSLSSDNAKSLDPYFAECVLEKATPELADSLGIPVNSEPLLLGIVSDATGEEFVLVAYVPENMADSVFATLRVFSCELVEVLP